MAGVDKVAERVRDYWRAQGLWLDVPSKTDIEAAAGRIGAELPRDFVAFLMGGLPNDDCKNNFWFWRAHELRSANEYGAGHWCKTAEVGVIFADYLQESWAYLLWLSGPLKGKVTLVLDGLDDQPVVGSFEEFLAAYRCDDKSLYPSDEWYEEFSRRQKSAVQSKVAPQGTDGE